MRQRNIIMKKTLAVITSATLLFASSAFASGFGPAPASMEDEATDYIEQRLENPNGSSVKAVSAPYKVTADLNGGRLHVTIRTGANGLGTANGKRIFPKNLGSMTCF